MTGSPPQVAVGAVVVHDGALLVVQRTQSPGAGRWSVPGGRVEAGERLRDALAREVREETGLDVEIGDFAGWVEVIEPEHHFVILDFFAFPRGSTGAIAGDDAREVRWVPLADVAALELVDGLLEFLGNIGSLAP